VIAPSITIVKDDNDNGDDTQTILTGGTATFKVTVTNDGDVDLTDVRVTDGTTPLCDNVIGNLASGASTSYTCTFTGATADFSSTSSVVGTPPTGPNVSDSDPTDVVVIDPSILIAKDPATQQIVSGGMASFTITVTNTGDVDLTDVSVSDALAPDCDATIGALAAGASTDYTCELTNVTADFTNSATATGTPPVGPDVDSTDTADVDVIAPSITIVKDDNDNGDDTQTILTGGTATFKVTVTNDGDVDLTDVRVTDGTTPLCDNVIGNLASGASTSYTCTFTGATADFSSTSSVVGTPPTGPNVSDSDPTDVVVIDPSILIAKDPATQQIVSGGMASFTITVTNTGDVDLTDVSVSDALAPDCDATIGALAAGASTDYTCELTNVTADFTNSATATGTPPVGPDVDSTDTAAVDVTNPSIQIDKDPSSQQVVEGGTASFTITVTNNGDVELTDISVSDALAPDCDRTGLGPLAAGASIDYTCELDNVTADFTNSATATGTPPVGPDVEHTDTADVDAIVPSISVEKTPDNQQVVNGDPVTWTITVTNDGDVDLTSVQVSDALASACDNSIGDLAVGASVSYDCTLDLATEDFTNEAIATGNPPIGDPVGDNDTADVDVINPSIDIEKDPADQQVIIGSPVTWTLTVTNTGDVDLTDVEVTDAIAPICDNAIGDLAAGASVSYDCTLEVVSGDFTNTADVTGTPPVGPPVTDSDDADVDAIDPSIEIEKTTSTPDIEDGETATFEITVTNTGDVDLENVEVTDALAPDCDNSIGSLASGASVTYSCTLTNVTSDLTNTAEASGTPPVGPPVTDSDDADVNVIEPAIEIAKGPDDQIVTEGSDVTFTITVTNSGEGPLNDVVVSDPLAPDCDRSLGTLAEGESNSYDCIFPNAQDDFVNTADVTGTPPAGADVTDSDNAPVDVIVTGTIIVHKSLASGSEPLPSFCFTLDPDPGNGEICADNNGNAVFEDIEEGTYLAFESTSPVTYSVLSSDCFDLTIASGGDVVECNIVNGLREDISSVRLPDPGGGGGASREEGERIIINEIQYQGTQANEADEWVELYNISPQDIDLTGWTLIWGDPDDNDGVVVQLGGTIPGNGFYVLERRREKTVSDIRADIIYDGILSDGGERMTLINRAGEVVDSANRNGGPWPAGTGALGEPAYATMERVDPFAPDTDENWKTNDGITRYGLDAAGEPLNGTRKAPNSAQDATRYELGEEVGLVFELGDADGNQVMNATPTLSINRVTVENGEERITPLLDLPEDTIRFIYDPATGEYTFIIDTELLGLGLYDLWIKLDGQDPKRVMRIEVVEPAMAIVNLHEKKNEEASLVSE
jgi:uncharacterized repeat protein (TIGR01451 family)